MAFLIPSEAAAAAAQWFIRLQDQAADVDDWLGFEAWLAASPANLAAYERLEQAWIDLDALPPEEARALGAAPVRQAPPLRARLSRRGWLAAGAALAASLAVAVLGLQQRETAASATYVTPPGQTREIRLADGTHVHLNAASRLVVRLEPRMRRVEMADAEAVFDVAHDPARPFLIQVGDQQVRVVGTEFNLRHRNGEIALTVRRGRVEVRPAGALDAAPTHVLAGQRLIHREGASDSSLSAAPLDAAFAWTQGQLVYSDAPLHEVAAELGRSLGAPVMVADEATARLRFTGVLEVGRPAAVMQVLEAFLPVRAESQGKGYLLRSSEDRP